MLNSMIAAWPGKTINNEYHSALWHMLDVGAVANRLIAKRPITESDSWNNAINALIALHDLGKISESFRDQITKKASRGVYHAQLSFVLLQMHDAEISNLIGGSAASRRALYAAVAGHHGGPPELDDGRGILEKRWNSAIGNDAIEASKQAITSIAALFPEATLEGLSSNDAKILSWKVSGLTIQADWIGSNTVWFGYHPPGIPIQSYWIKSCKRAEDAIAQAGLHNSEPRAASILQNGMKSRPMQYAALNAGMPEGPALAIIEDATGSGKTEAALILASRMMTDGKGDGLFFALPTMATSNAMFGRIEKVATDLFSGSPSLGLSHSRARQNAYFQKILGNSNSDPGEPVTCGQWLADDRRRILLADIGVGTIDQALLAVMPTRFNTLRLWALSGKILIVDEAHSYGPYMEAELCRLLRFHAMLGGSAIVMTATLPKGMRDAFSRAFQQGLGYKNPPSIKGDAFPQLTILGKEIDIFEPPPVPSTCRNIKVNRINEIQQALELIMEGVERSAACVWIRNSVDGAINAVQILEEQGIKADLLHARFTVEDRLLKEDELIKKFGRERGCDRGGVLVATQVVEASLDLDFDLMISDLAPIGSLIQRAGRLWRHMDLRPHQQRPVPGPTLNILSPDPEIVENQSWLKSLLKSGAYIYNLADQWRTAHAVFSANEIREPDHLRNLIESVHGEKAEDVPGELSCVEIKEYANQLIERQMAKNLLLSAHHGGRPQDYLSSAQKVHGEEKVATRLGIPQITLWLARTGINGIEPLAETWEASEVQISRKRYEKLGGVNQETLEIKELKKNWPEWKRSSIEVVVFNNGVMNKGLRYDSKYGLLIEY